MRNSGPGAKPRRMAQSVALSGCAPPAGPLRVEGALGLVHVPVGPPQEMVHALARPAPCGADRKAQGQRPGPRVIAGSPFPDARDEPLDLHRRQTGQDHDELVAPQAHRTARIGKSGAQDVAHAAQEIVARLVAEAVVGGLQAVEVDHRDGERLGARLETVHLVAEKGPVEEARQRIVDARGFEVAQRRLLQRDVLHADQVGGPVGFVAGQQPALVVDVERAAANGVVAGHDAGAQRAVPELADHLDEGGDLVVAEDRPDRRQELALVGRLVETKGLAVHRDEPHPPEKVLDAPGVVREAGAQVHQPLAAPDVEALLQEAEILQPHGGRGIFEGEGLALPQARVALAGRIGHRTLVHDRPMLGSSLHDPVRSPCGSHAGSHRPSLGPHAKTAPSSRDRSRGARPAAMRRDPVARGSEVAAGAAGMARRTDRASLGGTPRSKAFVQPLRLWRAA